MSPRRYKITVDGTDHDVEVSGVESSPIRVKVDGVDYDVELPNSPVRELSAAPSVKPGGVSRSTRSTTQDRPTPTPGPSANTMTAVMPGRILSVPVSVGDTVSRGDLICVIEAMKMEQQIGATRDGTISMVHVSDGDTVSHGQILVEFE